MRIKFKFLEKYAERLPAWVIPTVAIFGVSIYIFGSITHDVIGEQEEEVDHSIFNFLSAHVINPGMTEFMKNVTYLASAQFLQISYCILILFYIYPKKNYKRALEIFVIGASGLAINLAMKYTFHRLRPSDPLMEPLKNFSFPSGHATSGFIFYGTLVYLIWKSELHHGYKIASGVSLIGLALLIGFSRIYLRMHYASDVAAGLAVGLAWLTLLITIMERVKKKAKQETIREVVKPPEPGAKPEIAVPLNEIKEMSK